MSNVNIEIDGQKLQVPQGTMVIEAADDAGIAIPRFCYHKKLSIAANCRMCLVQVENAPKPMPACATPVSEGMKVFTQSEIAKSAQKAVMEFLLINHPLDCPVCDQGGQCELQDVALEYGKEISRFTEGKRAVPDKDIGPLIHTEMTRCIHCTRCVRYGQELAGLRELGATGRGEHTQIGTFIEKSVDSELSGNVIDICPVGALTAKPSRFKARAWEVKSRPSVASHDSLGTNVFHHIDNNKVIKTVPREQELLNEVWLSDRDRFAYAGTNHPQRLLAPKIKENGRWQEVSWEQALKTTSERLLKILNQQGPSQMGALASPNCTTEEFYLLQKLIHTLGCKNIDHRLRMMDDAREETHHACFETSLDALEASQAILLIGCHPRLEMPLLNQRIYKASQQGSKIYSLQVFADTRRYPLEQEILAPKGDLTLYLRQLTKALVEATKAVVPSSLQNLVQNVPENTACKAMAQALLADGSKVVMIGEDVYSHPQSATLRMLAAFCAKMLNTHLDELIPGANHQGAKLAGCLPNLGAFGHAHPSQVGLSAHQMITEPLAAMICLNFEPEFDSINPRLCVETLTRVKEVICISPYETNTMLEYADVLLPMVPVTESDGTYVNMFGMIQSFKAVAKPQGAARPAWKILRVLGNFMHLEGFDFNQTQDVLHELTAPFANMALDNKVDAYLGLPYSTANMPQGQLIRLSPCSIYRVDNIVRRSEPLQQTKENKHARRVFIHPDTAAAMGFQTDDVVKVIQDSRPGQEMFTLFEDTMVPENSILLFAGYGDRCDLGAPYSSIELNKLSEDRLSEGQMNV